MTQNQITTDMLDGLLPQINALYAHLVETQPYAADDWRAWRGETVQLLHKIYKPSTRPYAGQAMVAVFSRLLSEVDYLLDDFDELQDVHKMTQARAGELAEARRELASARQTIEQLQADLAKRTRPQAPQQPKQPSRAERPIQKSIFQSGLQREIIRIMGSEGRGRSWRIISHVIDAGIARNENSVRNALRKLTERGLLDDYRQHGKIVGWARASGGTFRLVTLTEKGRQFYSQAFEVEAVESEIAVAARRHKSVAHGVGILEARDLLLEAGYDVDDDPEPLLLDSDGRWSKRAEPDLVVVLDGVTWSVEVQREVSDRIMPKWSKTLSLTGRLALVLFNEEQRQKQEMLLEHAIALGRLPHGEILTASLEAMQQGEWEWRRIAIH
ncbi:MAG: hypothetical protein JW850_23800 [Thermoflexales bacterium]|nr:hypothetical protein [Thermoflexales bacterium]